MFDGSEETYKNLEFSFNVMYILLKGSTEQHLIRVVM